MSFLRRDHETATRPTVDCGPGKTKSNMKDASDINLIMARYKKTGLINFVDTRQAEYMDSNPINFHDAMNMIAESNSMFADMPAYLRKQFNNDPGKFLEFVHDPENTEKMIEMGLAQRSPQTITPESVEPTATAEEHPQAAPEVKK